MKVMNSLIAMENDFFPRPETKKRYYQFSEYLKTKFGAKVYKITLDAGFSCPNRDGTISSGGCIFCDDGGSFSRAHDSHLSVQQQVLTGVETLSARFKAKKFMSYFQAYSNTYKPVEELKQIYDASLCHKDVVGISIGTRPDCVDEKKLDLIASYTDKYETWVEYGLQSMHDRTLKFINRGHDFETFLKAYEKTKQKGINVCVHVILGLPGETKEDMLKTIKALSTLGVDGVKFHCLCIFPNTKLYDMYELGQIKLLEEDEYIDIACDCLELLPQKTTIHRLGGNGLQAIKVAPKWLNKKFEILNKIDAELEGRKSFQGSNFS